jgi:DNA-binding beta-propeller fold protein YncE
VGGITGFAYELLVRGEQGWLLSGDGRVQPMQLDSFGSFTLAGAQVNPVAAIQDCVLHPTLNIAYTINNATNLLTPIALTADSATGLSAQALATGTSPFRIAISRNGQLLFVTSTSDNQLYVYRVDALGVPTFLAALSAGANPQGIAVLENR